MTWFVMLQFDAHKVDNTKIPIECLVYFFEILIDIIKLLREPTSITFITTYTIPDRQSNPFRDALYSVRINLKQYISDKLGDE